eukprot:2353242-Prymnesium_polylepis.1
MAGPQAWGWSSRAWDGHQYYPGANATFHSFLSGPCKLQDQGILELANLYDHSTFGYVVETITCTAPSTCDNASAASLPRSAEYQAAREKTDAEYAIKVAQNLIISTAAFASSNDPSTTPVPVPPSPPRVSLRRPYKALVVLFMGGGADTFNLLVPHSNCDARNVSTQCASAAAARASRRPASQRLALRLQAGRTHRIPPRAALRYVETRGSAALSLDSVLPIELPAFQRGTQVCDTFGVHPRHTALRQLWDDGDASFVANVGSLVEPITQQEYIDKARQLPAGLFAHNLQTQGAQTLLPQTTTGNSGILGRIIQAFSDQAAGTGEPPLKGAAYSITSSRTIFRSSPVEPVLLSSSSGMI